MRNPNVNCLIGMKCPKCGSFAPFDIEVSMLQRFDDDGSGWDQPKNQDMEWEQSSHCECVGCKHIGKVADFTKEVEEP